MNSSKEQSNKSTQTPIILSASTFTQTVDTQLPSLPLARFFTTLKTTSKQPPYPKAFSNAKRW